MNMIRKAILVAYALAVIGVGIIYTPCLERVNVGLVRAIGYQWCWNRPEYGEVSWPQTLVNILVVTIIFFVIDRLSTKSSDKA
jgi:hypothetical protein